MQNFALSFAPVFAIGNNCGPGFIATILLPWR